MSRFILFSFRESIHRYSDKVLLLKVHLAIYMFPVNGIRVHLSTICMFSVWQGHVVTRFRKKKDNMSSIKQVHSSFD